MSCPERSELHTLCWFCKCYQKKTNPEPTNSLACLMGDAVYFTVFKDVFKAEFQFCVQPIFEPLMIDCSAFEEKYLLEKN